MPFGVALGLEGEGRVDPVHGTHLTSVDARGRPRQGPLSSP